MLKTRLIEAAFPLKQVSLDSVHEKNVQHEHISALHIWPARRPLAASRAALLATLLPDPGRRDERRKLLARMAGRVVETPGANGERMKEETRGGIFHWGREGSGELARLRAEIREAFGGARYAALEGALSPRLNFREFFKWFYALENEELREKKEQRDWDYQLPELKAVRKAIERMAPGVSDPLIKLRPLRFAVSLDSEAGKPEELALDQLSGGYRIVLALAADLARRMAQGNPHLADPLESEAVVLIDEVDLHLPPKWQQRILVDLRRTFPNAQFIVSTHSPQVLTTVPAGQIVELRYEEGSIVAGRPSAPTFGAEAGDVLFTVMGVDERPAAEHNEFMKKLNAYMRLVDDGRGQSKKAKTLRKELESLSARDPALDAADMEMERQEIFGRMERAS